MERNAKLVDFWFVGLLDKSLKGSSGKAVALVLLDNMDMDNIHIHIVHWILSIISILSIGYGVYSSSEHGSSEKLLVNLYMSL